MCVYRRSGYCRSTQRVTRYECLILVKGRIQFIVLKSSNRVSRIIWKPIHANNCNHSIHCDLFGNKTQSVKHNLLSLFELLLHFAHSIIYTLFESIIYVCSRALLYYTPKGYVEYMFAFTVLWQVQV